MPPTALPWAHICRQDGAVFARFEKRNKTSERIRCPGHDPGARHDGHQRAGNKGPGEGVGAVEKTRLPNSVKGFLTQALEIPSISRLLTSRHFRGFFP